MDIRTQVGRLRCIATKHGNNVRLYSRNRNDLTDGFPEIVDAILKLPVFSLTLDGEIVASIKKAVQASRDCKTGTATIAIFAFTPSTFLSSTKKNWRGSSCMSEGPGSNRSCAVQPRGFLHRLSVSTRFSVRQEPTSTRADFGTVGCDEKRFTTLLIFPKPLTDFLDSRIVGIKYDLVAESRVVPSAAPRSLKAPKALVRKPAHAVREPRSSQPVKTTLLKLARQKREEPKPKEFSVRVRVTVVTEKDVK